MGNAITQLDYAPDANRRHRRRFRRALLAAILSLFLILAIKWFRPAINHTQLLYYQHRCLTHTARPDQIVADSHLQVTQYVPSPDWGRFYAAFSPPGGRFTSTVFLGELRRKDTGSRLVSVDLRLGAHLDLGASTVAFDTHVIELAGLWSKPRLCQNRTWLSPFVTPWYPPSLYARSLKRLYAGQVDPSDHSHFTIEFEYGEQRGIVDGWLGTDDGILFELRNPFPRGLKLPITNSN